MDESPEVPEGGTLSTLPNSSSVSAESGMQEEVDEVVEETASGAPADNEDEAGKRGGDDGRPQALPLASASKIMTVKLQEHGFAMSKEARETVSDAATIFILYLATTYVVDAYTACSRTATLLSPEYRVPPEDCSPRGFGRGIKRKRPDYQAAKG